MGKYSCIIRRLYIKQQRVKSNIIVVTHVGERQVEIVENSKSKYISPLTDRYGDESMKLIFSDKNRHMVWRYLWYMLAKVEKELGLDISYEQVQEMRKNMFNPIDYDKVKKYEEEYKHDVMAHLREFCDRCPKAEPIIHLGATSCYIVDNADILLMDDALSIINDKISTLIHELSEFASKHKNTVTMAYTHLQPAQPTTVGKRACMWLQDILMDKDSLDAIKLKVLGCNGATGTQASFLELFDNEAWRVLKLNKMLSEELLGNEDKYMLISGQTYTRKVDTIVIDALSGIAQSLHKMCSDIRLLQGMHEVCEPFGSGQIGSSAMAYKQNPIKCENICSLSRHIISMTMTAKMNVCTQWLERSLDDSANRRMIIPEAFILTDHIINESIKIIQNLTVNEGVIERHIKDNIPFVSMESIIMEATKQGISRQEAHSIIRDLSVTAMNNVLSGGDNNLMDLVHNHEVLKDVNIEIDPNELAGVAENQVEMFLRRIKTK